VGRTISIARVTSPWRPLSGRAATRIEDLWPPDDRVELDRAIHGLYTWGRNAGSSAPESDFAACFSKGCRITWTFRRKYEVTIIMGGGSPDRQPLNFYLYPV